MKLLALFAFAWILSTSCLYSQDDPSKAAPVMRDGQPSKGYLKTHEDLIAEVKKKNPDLVLIGDSITYNWKAHGKKVRVQYMDKWNYVNLGLGGDRIENIIWRMQNGEIDNCKPKLAVLLAGTNNIPRKVTVDQIVSGMKVLLNTLQEKQPQMKIVLVGVLPRGDVKDERRKIAKEISEGYKELADGEKIIFLDLSDRLLLPDGNFREGVVCEDKLHLAHDGYLAWAEALEPIITKFK